MFSYVSVLATVDVCAVFEVNEVPRDLHKPHGTEIALTCFVCDEGEKRSVSGRQLYLCESYFFIISLVLFLRDVALSDGLHFGTIIGRDVINYI